MQTIYIKGNISKESLIKNGFKYNKEYSDQESIIYVKYIPLHKYKNVVTVNGEMLLDLHTGKVIMNVYDTGTKELYAPYYDRTYGRNEEFLQIIDDKITLEFKKLMKSIKG